MEGLYNGKYNNTFHYYSRKADPEGFKAYWENDNKIREEFKSDMFKELGISDHPKRELLFQKAWDRGHSGGYSEVFHIAVDLVELIR